MRFLILLKGGEERKGKELVVVVLYYKVTQKPKKKWKNSAAHQEVEKSPQQQLWRTEIKANSYDHYTLFFCSLSFQDYTKRSEFSLNILQNLVQGGDYY